MEDEDEDVWIRDASESPCLGREGIMKGGLLLDRGGVWC